jgi:WD40 repeat protein
VALARPAVSSVLHVSYDAFISYSHAADGKLAPALQSGLQAFARPWNRLRAIRVFRDKTDLTANPGLWSAITAALESSEYFLLLASEQSARSEWVRKELDYWLMRRPATHILLVITDGQILWDRAANDFEWTATTALPDVLRSRFSEEPLWVDLRWARSQEDLTIQNPEFRSVIADLSSAVRGIPKNELIGEDVRQHRKAVLFRRSALSGLGALAIALALATWTAMQQRDLARDNADRARENEALARKNEASARENEAAARLQAQRALARQLAAQSVFVRNRRAELPRAALLAAEAVRRYPEDAEVYQAARDALALLPRQPRELDLGGAVDNAIFGPAAGALVVVRNDRVDAWDLKRGRRTASVRLPDIVDALALSPDGTRFAAAENCRVIVHDVRTGQRLADSTLKQEVKPFSGPGCRTFTTMDISPDGRLVAAGGEAYVTRVWNIATDEVIDLRHTRSAPASSVRAVRFSPDGTRLASIRTGDVGLWTTTDWQLVDVADPPPWSYGERLAFSVSRGRYLGAVSGYGLTIWTVDNGGRAGSMTLSGDNFTRDVAIAFNNEVRSAMTSVLEGTMVAASAKNTAVVWSLGGRLSSGRELMRLEHQAPIHSISFSPDSRFLLTVSADNTASVWEVSSGEETARLVHTDGVRAAAFGADVVWTVDGAGRVREWDISSQPQTPVAEGTPVRFSADGTFVTVKQEFATEVIEARPPPGVSPRRFRGQYYATGDGAAGAVLEAHYAKTGLEVRDLLKGTRVMFLSNSEIDAQVDSKSFTHGIDGAFFSRDARHLAIHGPFFADVWEVPTGRRLRLGGAAGRLQDVVLSPDGRRAAGRLQDGPIRVVDLPSGQLAMQIPNANLERKMPLAFSPDGRYLASTDAPVRVWDTGATGAANPVYTSDAYQLRGEGFTADAAYFLAREGYGTVVVHELATGRTARYPGEGYALIRPSPSSSIVAIGAGNLVRLLDPRTGLDVARLDHAAISALAFSATGKHLATGGGDGWLRLWETTSWREVARVRHKGSIRAIQVSPDERFAAAGVTETEGSSAVTTYISQVRPEDPRAALCARVTRNLTADEWRRHLPDEPYEETCPGIK